MCINAARGQHAVSRLSVLLETSRLSGGGCILPAAYGENQHMECAELFNRWHNSSTVRGHHTPQLTSLDTHIHEVEILHFWAYG
jgi:hypothetical protein